MERTFLSLALGCRVNKAENDELDRRLIRYGFSKNEANPCLIIVNSCAVTTKAERETRQLVYRLKRKFPKAKIVITGCAATLWKKLNLTNLNRRLPVDLFVDNANKLSWPASWPALPHRVGEIEIGTTIQPNSKFVKSGRALIKIQDGCHRFCSYCIVPYLRGLPKSETIKNLELRVKNYEDKIKEVVFCAINTESFGYDTGERFVDLIDTIIKNTSIPRISFGSVHPGSINEKFLNYYKKTLKKKRLVNFFHIPLQSGSDKTLKLMKRGYTTKEFAWKVKEIKRINPYALVATDIIVGFLDESDKDFEDSYRFLGANPIDKFHVFRFSSRPYTSAYDMRKRLSEAPPDVKVKRSKALADLSQKKYGQFLQFLADNNYRSSVLLLDKFENGYQQALLDNQVPVWVKTDKSLAGNIKNVQVNKINSDSLFGELI